MDINKILEDYEKELTKKIRSCEKVRATSLVPNNATIHQKRQGNQTYYSLRNNYGGKQSAKETYIPKENTQLISQFLQMHYASKTLPFYEKQLNALKQFQKALSPATDINFYMHLTEESKHMLSPLVPYQPDIVAEWQNKKYRRNQYHLDEAINDTLRGELVRSKSEAMIANGLFHVDLSYYVEPLMYIGNSQFAPDFLILRPSDNKEVIWEHFGLMSNPQYADATVRKINRYALEGYHLGDNFIATFESESCPLSSRIVDEYIDRYLLGKFD